MYPFGLTAFIVSVASAAIIPSRENIANLDLELSRDVKKSLGFVEDGYLNFTELANKYGYQTEEHTAVTEDGYILKLFRIRNATREALGPPVLMMHGLADSPVAWILPGPGRGLAYLLADAGYDVWCPDYRGSKYTRSHVSLDPNKDIKFWKFGLDEISKYDLPLFINYVLNIRNVKTVAFVGHSLACRLFYQMEAYTPEIFAKVNVMISMAPSPWATNMYSPIFRFISTVTPELEAIANTIGLQEVFGSRSLMGNVLTQVLCARVDRFNRSLNEELCEFLLFNLFGPDHDQLTPELIPKIYGQNLCSMSIEMVAHVGQGLHSPKFQRYDRGFKGNMRAYGRATPPEYNPSLVTTPIAIFSGRNDWFSSIEDVKTLISKLPNLIEHYIVPRPKWNHIDHIYGIEAPILIGQRIIRILGNYTT